MDPRPRRHKIFTQLLILGLLTAVTSPQAHSQSADPTGAALSSDVKDLKSQVEGIKSSIEDLRKDMDSTNRTAKVARKNADAAVAVANHASVESAATAATIANPDAAPMIPPPAAPSQVPTGSLPAAAQAPGASPAAAAAPVAPVAAVTVPTADGKQSVAVPIAVTTTSPTTGQHSATAMVIPTDPTAAPADPKAGAKKLALIKGNDPDENYIVNVWEMPDRRILFERCPLSKAAESSLAPSAAECTTLGGRTVSRRELRDGTNRMTGEAWNKPVTETALLGTVGTGMFFLLPKLKGNFFGVSGRMAGLLFVVLSPGSIYGTFNDWKDLYYLRDRVNKTLGDNRLVAQDASGCAHTIEVDDSIYRYSSNLAELLRKLNN